MRAHHVRALLMGGQACVFYGAAEFSRDTDLAIVAGWALTPGRHVGAGEVADDGDPFEEKMPRLVAELHAQFAESAKLEAAIRANLNQLNIHP